ncbi:hypothetical protein B0H12DRAFT_1319700 [Mycena haematopus]|nr:hypothetical protein B0H12DRAFT_1319700 [Mycena haematopus]
MSSRSRAGGLPSGPGPRARSVARTRDADRSRYDDDSDGVASSRSSARQVRPQKSMTSLNQSRSDPRPPPMPSSRSRRPTYESSRSDSGTNRSSDTSTTSSGSSFLDRMKQTAGYASSRTSLEDDEPDNKRSARSTRNRPSRRDSSPPELDETETETHGDTLWSRIATSLTVNVSKAWATNITAFAGEDAETPVGQESRLTRAMKAYHLEKARDPADLPAWLFDEKERRRPEPEPSRSRRRKEEYDDDNYEVVEKTRPEPPPSRGLKDIYAAAAASTTSTAASTATSARSTRGARSYADDSPQPSRATDRLKALRDAKRGAVNPPREEERVRDPEPEAPPPRRRVGLPSGPVSRRS